jgi:hypothetical protein
MELMRAWLSILALVLLPAGWVKAEIKCPLDVNLSSPADKFINAQDCSNAENIEFILQWSVSDACPLDASNWTGKQNADVFLSSSEECSAVSVEIGKVAADVDIKIAVGATSGRFPVTPDELFLSDISGLDCSAGSASQQDYYFCIKWNWTFTPVIGNDVDYSLRGGTKIRFDTKKPAAPTLESVQSGEGNLKLAWEPPGDDDLQGFKVYCRKKGAENWNSPRIITSSSEKTYQISGLDNYTTYEVQVVAFDGAGNESDGSIILEGTPETINDFYEFYKGSGGQEQGGYCFVATAAFGSYQSSLVQPLRTFRDSVLAQSEVGREFIGAYYRYGPRWARAIRQSESHRSVARWCLLPLVGLASLFQCGSWVVGLGLLGLLTGLFVLIRARPKQGRWMTSSSLTKLSAGFLLVGLLGAGRTATAETSEPGHQFQLRLGMYQPRIDSEKNLDGHRPFESIFGSDSELLVEAGLDYQVWRGFGAVTVGASLGFVQYLGKGRTLSGAVSNDTTAFNLVPLRLSVGYHANMLEVLFGIPLVPYVQGGLSYFLWWATDGVGHTAQWARAGDENTFSANGGILGYHFGVGLKFLLDILDRSSAANFEYNVGVLNTYFFVEYSLSGVMDSSDHLNLGDDLLFFGLMMDF